MGRKIDQAHGLIGVSISPDLRFHLDGEDSLVKSWEKLNKIFGIKMRFGPFNLKMSYLPQILVSFLLLNIAYPNLRPLNLFQKVVKFKRKKSPPFMTFLLSYLQHTQSLYPPSILLEKLLFMQELSIKLLPLMFSAIP